MKKLISFIAQFVERLKRTYGPTKQESRKEATQGAINSKSFSLRMIRTRRKTAMAASNENVAERATRVDIFVALCPIDVRRPADDSEHVPVVPKISDVILVWCKIFCIRL